VSDSYGRSVRADYVRRYEEINRMFIAFVDYVIEHRSESEAKAVQYALAWVLDSDEPDELLTQFLKEKSV
jgi:hypothetical protein